MTNDTENFTIGVEEEYQIVDAATRELKPRADRVLPDAQQSIGEHVQPELYLSQIEIGTPICRTLKEVRSTLVHLRREVIAAAERDGNRIASAGTHPFSHWQDQELTPKARYIGIEQDYQQLAREQLIFGCHVHVGIKDREVAIQVMNRVLPWLSVLLALSANSPYWLGVDTGYASFRTEIWRRWPMAGTPLPFVSRTEFDVLVEDLVSAGTISDGTKIYWDVRPSARYETLEFRVGDVCMNIDEAVMIAGLTRALARTCHAEVMRGEHVTGIRTELLRAAHWQAARYGLDADLIDIHARRPVPASVLAESFLAYLRPTLEEHNEWEEVSALMKENMARGTGASRQRAAYARRESFADVIDLIVEETARGTA